MNRFLGMVLSEERANGFLRDGVWTRETFIDVFERNVRDFGDVQHRDESRKLTYRELWQECESIAAALRDLGIKKGDKVAIQFPTSLDYLVALFGIARIGAVAVVLQTDLGRQALADSLSQSEASVLFVANNYRGQPLAETADSLRSEVEGLTTLIVRGQSEMSFPNTLSFEKIRDAKNSLTPTEASANRPEALDPFMMVFTAGTTGSPKGIVHLHANTLWAARTYAQLYGLQPGDGMLDLAPIYHLTGMLVGVTMPVATGGRILFLDRFSATRALQWIAQERPRCLVGAPPHLIHIAESSGLTKSDTSSVRFFFYAGAPVASSILSQLQTDTGWTVGGLFGWSEGFLACATRPDDSPETISTTVGLPIPGVEIQLVGEDGSPVQRGTPGEMICRGPSFSAGYYNNPQAAARKWDAQGWFHSGDLLLQNDRGQFVYAGRVDDIINRGGTKIDPEIVEDVLLTHPDIEKAAVFGVPDKTVGQRTVAALVMKHGVTPVTPDALRGFLEGKGLAKFQIPDNLAFLDLSKDVDMHRLGRRDLRSLYDQQTEQ